MMGQLLTAEQHQRFHADGLVVVPGFYDLERDIVPIQRGIHGVIARIISRERLSIAQPPFASATFDAGYQAIIAHDRRLGGEIYDAVKQIPAFMRLVAMERNEQALRELRATDLPGLAAGGYGIRIDNPSEERFRADWHQEYPAQLRSLDGVVFWSPLVSVSEELGPVRFCIGSHRDGPVRVHTSDPDRPDKSGAYGLVLEDRDRRVARYPQIAPLSRPGDLILVDFLTLHASGVNRGQRSRWSMQFRYFNFNEATGIRNGWRGSYAAGVDFAKVHPELLAD
jgi:Phytanoyl-CoA dioxygenase (PhyH)